MLLLLLLSILSYRFHSIIFPDIYLVVDLTLLSSLYEAHEIKYIIMEKSVWEFLYWINLTQNSDQCRDFVSTVMNLCAPLVGHAL